jgi:multimeric flavodoxin WrbA
MSAVVLDALERENNIEGALKNLFSERGEELNYFKLGDMNIKRCTGCGACGDKTPGKCVIKDDMQQVFRAIAKGEWVVLLTPLRFGGYSSQIKIAIDRFMVLGLPFYYLKEGTLFHQSRYEHKYWFGIAMEEDKLQGQEENFKKIIAQNAANLSYTDKALIIRPEDSLSKIQSEIGKILEGGA